MYKRFFDEYNLTLIQTKGLSFDSNGMEASYVIVTLVFLFNYGFISRGCIYFNLLFLLFLKCLLVYILILVIFLYMDYLLKVMREMYSKELYIHSDDNNKGYGYTII